MSNDLLDRLGVLGQHLDDERTAATIERTAPPEQHRTRGRRALAGTVAAAIVAVGVAGLVVIRHQRHTPPSAAPAGPVLAEQQLAELVADAGTAVGWTIALPGDLTASESRTDGAGIDFAEVHLTLHDRGALLVSISTGDTAAAAVGTNNRGGLLRTVGSATIYLGTDSTTARAVELFDGSTIIYVRSESATEAESLDDLTAVALTLDHTWQPDTLQFDTTNTVPTAVSTPIATTGEVGGSTLPPSTQATTVDLANTLTPGTSETLPVSPLAGRIDPMAVWTGSRVIIWGGAAPKPASGETPFDDGALYDPVARSWTMLPPAPISARCNAATVWTGTEMLVWGGSDNGTSLTDGAAYSPTTNTWRPLPTFDMNATVRPTTAWTGTEMIVLDGINGTPHGGAYNPTSDTWRTVATPPGRSATPYPQAVWTGSEVVATLTTGTNDTPIIAAYNPTADNWEQLATDIGSGQRPSLLWTGTEMLAFGMTDTIGGAWNPTTRTWRTTTTAPSTPASGAQPVWTGTLAVFWNGGPSISTYDPAADIWTDNPGGELPEQRLDGVRIWADGILLTWGGFISNPGGTASGADDGIAWRPNSTA